MKKNGDLELMCVGGSCSGRMVTIGKSSVIGIMHGEPWPVKSNTGTAELYRLHRFTQRQFDDRVYPYGQIFVPASWTSEQALQAIKDQDNPM